jgi:hypothetical protein
MLETLLGSILMPKPVPMWRPGLIRLSVGYAVVAFPVADLDRGCLVFVRGGLCVEYGRRGGYRFLARYRLQRWCSQL